jgi:hypothetical protein
MWTTTCLIRFGPEYPFYPDVYQLILCIGRDIVGILFCYILIKPLFEKQFLRFNSAFFKAIMYGEAFFLVWFMFAPTPGFADWNFAIRNNYPQAIIINDFLTSHVLGRIFLLTMLYNLID